MTTFSHTALYSEFKDVFAELISTFVQHVEILRSSERLVMNEIKAHFVLAVANNTKGKLFKEPECIVCK